MPHADFPAHLKRISGTCALALLEIIDKCLHCESDEDYRKIFKMLNNLIAFDQSTSGLAELDTRNGVMAVVSYDLININYPEKWLGVYKEKEFDKVDVIVQNNFTNFMPQYWAHTYKKTPPSPKFISLASDFNIRNGYTIGAAPFGSCKRASLYSFAGGFKRFEPRVISILRTIVPHLHLASSRILGAKRTQTNNRILTDREKEVLKWIKHGKSSWDISMILAVSLGTVNFHTQNLMRKLDVVNRAQAVAMAVHLGILDID